MGGLIIQPSGSRVTIGAARPLGLSQKRLRQLLCGSLYLFFFFFATPQGMWDLNSPTRDQTHAPCSGNTES